MAFDKVMPSAISEYEIYSVSSTDELEKEASSKIDLPEGFVFDPDYLYMWVRIISAGEYYGPNKNGDYFPEEELISYYQSFNEAHVFKNHENKKIEKAIGRIFSVRWNPVMKCVEIFKGVDRKIAPEIVRGFEKGYLTDVSMGCKVPYTVCSVCGNKARRKSEFCEHVNKYRMQYLGNGERVFEINYEPKFHDSSVVLNGAERVAKAMMIIDKPPSNVLSASFQKAASTSGKTRFVRLSDHEMNKVASHKATLHPILQPEATEKIASDNPWLDKIAELEKEVTGKILNVVSTPSANVPKAADQLIQIVKFLTEKRFDEGTLKNISITLNELSRSEKLPISRVFSTFIGVSELMGIELFPTELHTILSNITNSRLDRALELSDADEEELYPSDFAKGVKTTLSATEQLPEFKDTSSLVNLYDEFPHQKEMFKSDPFSFVRSMDTGMDLEEDASSSSVRIIRGLLEPMMSIRSQHAEHLLPRLAIVLSGHRSVMGGEDARRDLDVMASPKTLGDLLATISYCNYQRMRPAIKVARLVKMASMFDTELEKMAAEQKPSKGIKRRHLAAVALPTIFGASHFQKSREKNGRNLSDAEKFLADRPDVIASGVVIAGKPLSAKLINGTRAAAKATKQKTSEVTERMKEGFKKLTFEETDELVKVADVFSSGSFNVFDDICMNRFAERYALTRSEAAVAKVATLLRVSGMEKEASELLAKSPSLGDEATGALLKEAMDYGSEELHKAAGDFTNTLVLDGIIDQRPFATTLHGRMVDAFVMKKLGDLTKPKEPAGSSKGSDFDVSK